jgi:valyl-tRNA synthetase
MAQQLYQFVWNDYCSWALELSKTRFADSDHAVRRGSLSVMGSVLADMLRLLHPVVPFVSEELWSRVRPALDELGLWLDREPSAELLVLERYPEPRNEPDREIEERFAIVQRLVGAVRQLRATSNIKDNLAITVQVKPLHPATRPMLERLHDSVCFLARLDAIEFVEQRAKGTAAQYDGAYELYINLGKYIDLREEVARLEREIAKLERGMAQDRGKLENPKFVERAPADKVDAVRDRLADAEQKLAKLRATRDELAD